MLELISYVFGASFFAMMLVGGYFFMGTKGSWLIQRKFYPEKSDNIYWIYKNAVLIWITDRQFIVWLILLGQYSKMVDAIISSINSNTKKGKKVLQIGCAFGNISKRIANECKDSNLTIVDIIPNEIKRSRKKIKKAKIENCAFLLEDATNLSHKDSFFDCVFLFFLFHELPYQEKKESLKEAARVLEPKGKIIFSEFHKPEKKTLRILGWIFFRVFEPHAKEMWEDFNTTEVLNKETPFKWRISTRKYLFGNYQVTTAKKIH
ncbi:MAG: hypothetical protein COU71_02305 [Parcubacteria group bacterium CG10_big_fil_rev_8_21_14_0_10_38_31]|nr:MAG: hypothetical protein COU71_02305 [Parcubacteria group bacterium CG10_big_fil_rev_8_21_14_0_10_38_31]